MPENDLIGTAEAAEILGQSQRTAKRMAAAGVLPVAVRLTGGQGAYLFHRAEVERLRDRRAAERAEVAL